MFKQRQKVTAKGIETQIENVSLILNHKKDVEEAVRNYSGGVKSIDKN